jgi:hypothetical protein
VLALLSLSLGWKTYDLIVSLQGQPILSASEVSGKKIALAPRPRLKKIAEDHLRAGEFRIVPTREAALQELCAGRVAATVMESRILDSILLKRPAGCEGAPFRVSTIPGLNHSPRRHGGPQFEAQLQRISAEITKMAADGTSSAALDKWCPFTAGRRGPPGNLAQQWT